MPAGFYNQDGDYLGNDGNLKDGRLFVVTDKEEIKKIKTNESKKGKTEVSSVKSAVEMPSLLVRQAIGAAVERSGKPTADDREGGFHEEGLIAGPAVDGGKETVQIAAAGAYSDPRVDDKASIDTTIPADTRQSGSLADITVMATYS